MKPSETLVVRVVRERWGDMFKQPGFQEFESLSQWEYRDAE